MRRRMRYGSGWRRRGRREMESEVFDAYWYGGQWVAVDRNDRRVLAFGLDPKEVLKEAREKNSRPLLIFVLPESERIPFGGW